MTPETEKLYRVECICSKCETFLMGTDENPHMTEKELGNKWAGLVISAPLNAPKCPSCKYSTDRDYNAGVSFMIDDGENKVTSKEFFKK